MIRRTLNVEDDAVGDTLALVGDDTGELLAVTLSARNEHVVTAERDGAVGVAGLLDDGLTLQLGLPVDVTGRLAVCRKACSHLHLVLLALRDDGGCCQGHMGYGACWGKQSRC